MKRIALALALACATTVAGVGVGEASAAPMFTGPACRPDVVTAVLGALHQAGIQLPSGQQVQYLQVSQRADGTYYLEPCVVTVP